MNRGRAFAFHSGRKDGEIRALVRINTVYLRDPWSRTFGRPDITTLFCPAATSNLKTLVI